MRDLSARFLLGMSGAALALSCRSPPATTMAKPPPPSSSPPRADAGAAVGSEADGPERTTIEMDGKPVEITRADADGLARALLVRIRDSKLEPVEKEVLLSRTFPQGFIDFEGTVRIDQWVLMDFFGRWGLLFRFLPPDPAQYTAFFAPVTLGAAGLQVGEVARVHFHPPRHPQP